MRVVISYIIAWVIFWVSCLAGGFIMLGVNKAVISGHHSSILLILLSILLIPLLCAVPLTVATVAGVLSGLAFVKLVGRRARHHALYCCISMGVFIAVQAWVYGADDRLIGLLISLALVAVYAYVLMRTCAVTTRISNQANPVVR